jgi:hypothetical protein
MSAQRRIDAFFTLADRGLRIANILFRENLFEDATLTFSRLLNGSHANLASASSRVRHRQNTHLMAFAARTFRTSLGVPDGALQ